MPSYSETMDHPDPSPRRWRMKCPHLQTCFCKISLKTGCTLISIWSMTESLLNMVYTVVMLYKIHTVPYCDKDENNDVYGNTSRDAVDSLNRPCITSDQMITRHNRIAGMVVTLFIVFIYYLISALLLYGVRKGKPGMMKLWLWWSVGEMLMMIRPYTILENFIPTLIKIYWCLVVYSYIRELREQEERGESPEDVMTYSHLRGRVNTNSSGGVYNTTTAPITSPPPLFSIPGGSANLFNHHMTPEEVAAKVDAACAARAYGQQPPAYTDAIASTAEPYDVTGTQLPVVNVPPPTYEEATSVHTTVFLPPVAAGDPPTLAASDSQADEASSRPSQQDDSSRHHTITLDQQQSSPRRSQQTSDDVPVTTADDAATSSSSTSHRGAWMV